MNAKTAKQLRKAAKIAFHSTPASEEAKQSHIEIEKNRKIMLNREGKPFFAASGTTVNNPITLRGIYRALKRNFVKAERAK